MALQGLGVKTSGEHSLGRLLESVLWKHTQKKKKKKMKRRLPYQIIKFPLLFQYRVENTPT